MNDIFITLWESRPIFEKVKDELTENMVDRVKVDPETELPILETINRGILRISLWHWLKKSPQNPSYSTSSKKSDKQAQEK